MNILQKIFSSKEEETKKDPERTVRDLLRELLNTIPVDVFYLDDPYLSYPPEQQKEYLKYFADIKKDGRLETRLKYLINKQALKTLASANNNNSPVFDVAGSMTMNGIAVVKDDIQKLAVMHAKESGNQPAEFNKQGI